MADKVDSQIRRLPRKIQKVETAKGGVVVAIRQEIDIPVKFIGLGEKPEDIERFDATRFVEALFE